ncbi:MAG: sn-glycerol-3-phosphate ABC transporter ATP-binding protein UgpC [Clostridia bacterium]|nr:sn-glycerol-3-phosphate ABC transporter ATP-binding protein UgpC [Clostridia bacterium]
MASLSLRQIGKIYQGGVVGAKDINLEIQDKEFLILVGPSGCGKSTTLRMIAGLEEISEGELYIDDTLVNDIAPKDRDIAMVFQNYALYPHMTVFDNMAFGLKLRKVPKDVINEKVHAAAKILDIEHLLDRKPRALSGGQRQRVALGRAIVREPKVFLMDEPLSNLDAKLRVQMRAEIGKLHQRLGTTVVYVTHDQTEAMTMGSRIAVMKDGYLQQCATPIELYDEPVNIFVAGFIGSPQMNFINVTLEKKEDGVYLVNDKVNIKLPEGKGNREELAEYFGKEVVMGIRPESIYEDEAHIASMPEAVVEVEVDLTEMMGAETYLYLKCGETPMIARVNRRTTAKSGDTIKAVFDTNKIHLFDKDSERAILH